MQSAISIGDTTYPTRKKATLYKARTSILFQDDFMAKVLANENLPASAKNLAIRLSIHPHTQSANVAPTIDRLAEWTSSSRSAVHRNLALLRKAGYVR